MVQRSHRAEHAYRCIRETSSLSPLRKSERACYSQTYITKGFVMCARFAFTAGMV